MLMVLSLGSEECLVLRTLVNYKEISFKKLTKCTLKGIIPFK